MVEDRDPKQPQGGGHGCGLLFPAGASAVGTALRLRVLNPDHHLAGRAARAQ